MKANFLVIIIVLMTNVLLAQQQNSVNTKETPLIGIWKSNNQEQSVIINIKDAKHYQWNKESGRYAIQGSTVWFITDSLNTGTKWDFVLDNNELILNKPEDFKYLGKGDYIYFQLTSPKQKIILKRN